MLPLLVFKLTVLSFLLALGTTAWPTMQLFDREYDPTDTGYNSYEDAQTSEATNMALALKAYAFNFGYTALSTDSSCKGSDYPLEYACIESDAYRCVDVPGDTLEDDPIVACKSFDEMFDTFTELTDCALGDPSGQADLFGHFYDAYGPDEDPELPASTTPISTSSSITGSPVTAPMSIVQTAPEMTSTDTDAGSSDATPATSLPTALPPATSMAATRMADSRSVASALSATTSSWA
ncbi:unnamed protein product [Peniophora sp. CBMAI 1063]|nr:unnamed protein product [Peniophora sp. CBMAI 1063]